MSLIRGRVDDMLSKVHQAVDMTILSRDEGDSLIREINEYFAKEQHLVASRLSISDDFKQAGKIKNKDARRKFLDEARAKREARRIDDSKVRDEVIHLRGHLQEVVAQLFGTSNEL